MSSPISADRPREELLAIAVRHEQRLGRGRIDPVAVARALGLEVVSYPVEDGGVEGQYRPLAPSSGAIFVNSNASVLRQRFTVAHEIGHALLHAGSVIVDDVIETPARTRPEREADRFAGALLVDPGTAGQLFDALGRDVDAVVARLVQVFEVSVPAAVRSLEQFGLIARTETDSFIERYTGVGHRAFMESHGYRSRHRDGTGTLERDAKFDERVVFLLAHGQLSPEVAAGLLGTTVDALPTDALRAHDSLAALAEPVFD